MSVFNMLSFHFPDAKNYHTNLLATLNGTDLPLLSFSNELLNDFTNTQMISTRQNVDVIFSFQTASSLSCRRRSLPLGDLGSFSMNVTPPRSLLFGETFSANQSSF